MGSPMLTICFDELLIVPPSKLNPWERSELVCYSIYQKRRGQFSRDNMLSIIMMINLIAGEIRSMQRTSTVCCEYTSPTNTRKIYLNAKQRKFCCVSSFLMSQTPPATWSRCIDNCAPLDDIAEQRVHDHSRFSDNACAQQDIGKIAKQLQGANTRWDAKLTAEHMLQRNSWCFALRWPIACDLEKYILIGPHYGLKYV